MKKQIAAVLTAVSVAATLAGCGSASTGSGASVVTAASGSETASTAETSGDTVVIGETSMVDSIDPTNNGDPWSLTADGISETLYNQDENGNLVSHLAESVVQNDALDWTLTLKSGMKFSDGSPVNAQAVADCINDIMANNEMATASRQGSLRPIIRLPAM